ncbi:MAG: hypothetical protein P1P84_02355 [Deferrisomatales bacterium]|nr:hypothetical protein [Deferrisomatales bacterium]
MRPRDVLFLLLTTAVAVLPAAADETTNPATPGESTPPVEVRMGEVEIKGELERPGVFYIIPRREVEMDLGRQTRDYTPELSRPLDPAAFERWVRLQQTAR